MQTKHWRHLLTVIFTISESSLLGMEFSACSHTREEKEMPFFFFFLGLTHICRAQKIVYKGMQEKSNPGNFEISECISDRKEKEMCLLLTRGCHKSNSLTPLKWTVVI